MGSQYKLHYLWCTTLALRELGRIERTLFTLDWLQDIELRRRVQIRFEQGRGQECAGPRRVLQPAG